MTAYLIVRAEVEEESREGFDQWYEMEHLPDAFRDFKAVSATRGWSDVEPGMHTAFYEFSDLKTANAILNSELIKEFIKEFDRHWNGKVKRTRDILDIKQNNLEGQFSTYLVGRSKSIPSFDPHIKPGAGLGLTCNSNPFR